MCGREAGSDPAAGILHLWLPRESQAHHQTHAGSLKACLALGCFLIFKGSGCPRKSALVAPLPVQSPAPSSRAVCYPCRVLLPPQPCVAKGHCPVPLPWVLSSKTAAGGDVCVWTWPTLSPKTSLLASQGCFKTPTHLPGASTSPSLSFSG